jgi:hypothetical protein
MQNEESRMSTFSKTAMAQCFLAAACLLAVTATQVNADDQVWTTKVNGVISEMRSGLIMVTTSWGTMTIQSDALTEAKVGDEITVWVNENNVVIDAYPKGAARPHHRWGERQSDLHIRESGSNYPLDSGGQEGLHRETELIEVRELCGREPDHCAVERQG